MFLHVDDNQNPDDARQASSIFSEVGLMRAHQNLFDFEGVPLRSQMHFGLQVGPGWLELVGRMLEGLSSLMSAGQLGGFKIVSVKSKFGSLRVAYSGGTEKVLAAADHLIDAARNEARVTCETCGGVGEQAEVGGYGEVQCDGCRSQKGSRDLIL